MISSAALFLALSQGPTVPARPAPDAVLATVGGKPLTAAEVEPYLWAWRSREVVREIADARAIEAAAAKQGVTVTDAEVKARMDQQLEAMKKNLQPGQTVEGLLAAQGADMSRLSLAIRRLLLVDKTIDLEFKPEAFYKTDTLLFRTNGDTTDGLKGAIAAADQAYAKLMAGKPWDDVVKASSTGPKAVGAGAPMGWKSAEVFPESVRKQLDATKPMGYTKPTQTPYGIQIFRLDARGKEAPAAELEALRGQYREAKRQEAFQRLRAAVPVEVK